MTKRGLKKEERIKSRKLIDYIFSGKATSFSNFPIRVVYIENPQKDTARAKILVSVSKKRLKHAVDRNSVKRLIREAYRLNKSELMDFLEEKDKNIAISFIYLANTIQPHSIIEKKIKKLLSLIIEKEYVHEKNNS